MINPLAVIITGFIIIFIIQSVKYFKERLTIDRARKLDPRQVRFSYFKVDIIGVPGASKVLIQATGKECYSNYLKSEEEAKSFIKHFFDNPNPLIKYNPHLEGDN